jgi:selenocysteine lyase/cysteine desulfurase
MGLTVYSSRRPAERSGVVSLLPPEGADAREIVRRCRDQGVVINSRLGRLRISPHCYNTIEELDRLLDLLR